ALLISFSLPLSGRRLLTRDHPVCFLGVMHKKSLSAVVAEWPAGRPFSGEDANVSNGKTEDAGG
ncbi:hypothetical protein, partial [Stutzerimonas nitrititolerans]|uniref:hypothetical protein n=1 Tax=Stutzerimonas nitrititolerans TaxID=2482751 RepID=UPI002898A958